VNETTIQMRVKEELKLWDEGSVPLSRRSIVVYHLGELSNEESIDVAENNVKVFTAAVLAHTNSAHHRAFYIFRVVGGKRNVLARHLPLGSPNSVISKCSHHSRDIMAQINTIHVLGTEVVDKVHSLLFVNHDARGPFEGRENGAWWDRITNIFNTYPQVGLIGATISCEITAHVQSHAIAVRAKAAWSIFEEFDPSTPTGKRNRAAHPEIALSSVAIAKGYKLSSLAYERHWKEPEYVGRCISSKGNYQLYNANPTSWCDIRPDEALFTRWGGPTLSLRGYYCQKHIDNIHEATMKIAESEHSVHLALPETIFGGPLYALSKEYDLERWNDKSLKRVKYNSLPRGGETPQKVCFLVRAAWMHGKNATKRANSVQMDLDLFITTLLRQSNPNWDAYFFVTDDQPFEDELRVILREYADIRLKYLHLDPKFRPKYDPVNAAYPASDEALRLVMQKPECVRLSVTNGDNAYGSEVVATVLDPKATSADLILLSMDNRNFARSECRQLRKKNKNEDYTGYCEYFEKKYKEEIYGYARTPAVRIGGVDLASVFIERNKFIKSNIFFNEFSSAKISGSCAGCQDGAWVQTMVRKHKWTTHIPPISGLKHMIFHGPSPLWCIASGNVWFDHPSSVACVSHAAVGRLNTTLYDLRLFHSRDSSKICLRLTEEGFRHKNQTYLG